MDFVGVSPKFKLGKKQKELLGRALGRVGNAKPVARMGNWKGATKSRDPQTHELITRSRERARVRGGSLFDRHGGGHISLHAMNVIPPR